jgi:hypothetical protein
MRRRWLSAVVRATRAWRGRREHARGRRGRRATAGGDAQLTKGLAALLVLGLSGASAADVVEGAMEFIELPGTKQSLSLSRNSGVPSELGNANRRRAGRVRAQQVRDPGGGEQLGVSSGARVRQQACVAAAQEQFAGSAGANVSDGSAVTGCGSRAEARE